MTIVSLTDLSQSSLVQWLVKGGPTMGPLMICSILVLAVSIQKWRILRSYVKSTPKNLVSETRLMLAQHKDQQALGRCRAIDSPLARILAELIHNAHGPIEDMPEVAQIAGRREALLLGTHLDVLSTIKAISPLLGLLGTVIGMIQTFTGMSLHGSGDIGALAGGISTALITTATGLSIAIPALVLHKYFSQKVGSIVSDLEISAEEIIRLLKNRENRTDKEISEAQVPSRR